MGCPERGDNQTENDRDTPARVNHEIRGESGTILALGSESKKKGRRPAQCGAAGPSRA
jgi:hypothetical protein